MGAGNLARCGLGTHMPCWFIAGCAKRCCEGAPPGGRLEACLLDGCLSAGPAGAEKTGAWSVSIIPAALSRADLGNSPFPILGLSQSATATC